MLERAIVQRQLELGLMQASEWITGVCIPGREHEQTLARHAPATLWRWTRGRGLALSDGSVLSLSNLLGWRVALQDQLQFELGELLYAEARIDDAAKQLWAWLARRSPPPRMSAAPQLRAVI
ncbi:MAG: hypothetical protein ABW352_08755 [Polyangiales bacterium]